MNFKKGYWYRADVSKDFNWDSYPQGLRFFQDGKWHLCTGVDEYNAEGYAMFESSAFPTRLWNFNNYTWFRIQESRDPAVLEIEQAKETTIPTGGTRKRISVSLTKEQSNLRNLLRKELGYQLLETLDRRVYQLGLEAIHVQEHEGLSQEVEFRTGKEAFPSARYAKNQSKRNRTRIDSALLFKVILPGISDAIKEGTNRFSFEGIMSEQVKDFITERGYSLNITERNKNTITW